MKRIGIGIGVLLAVAVLVLGGGWLYVSTTAAGMVSEIVGASPRMIEVPWPLSEAERSELQTRAEVAAQAAAAASLAASGSLAGTPPQVAVTVDFDAVALERAIARGEHLATTQLHCQECHGEDMGGQVMAEDGMFGTWVAPDATQGGVAATYTTADWLRLLRHGVRKDSRRANMPPIEVYAEYLTDRDVSDVIAWARTLEPAPPRTLPAQRLGPIMKMLLVTGEWVMPFDAIDHQHVAPAEPPPVGPTAEYGAHVGVVCTVCHYEDLRGGPPLIGGPEMTPAPNITLDPSGIAGWSARDFDAATRAGITKDGRTMSLDMPSDRFAGFTPTEMDALWAWVQSVPAGPQPERE